MQHKTLYIVLVFCLFLLVLFSLGKGFWGAPETGVHWTEKFFSGVCHQMPDRTYTISGELMAVNTRCFGIFTGLWVGWCFIPFLKSFTVEKKWPYLLLLFAVVIQIIDYSGNMFQLWENTNHSRAFLGFIFGVAMPIFISDQFQKTNHTN